MVMVCCKWTTKSYNCTSVIESKVVLLLWLFFFLFKTGTCLQDCKFRILNNLGMNFPMNLGPCTHPCYAALCSMVLNKFRLHLFIYLSLHSPYPPPSWKVSKMTLKLCFLAENFLHVKFEYCEVWVVWNLIRPVCSGDWWWGYLNVKQQPRTVRGRGDRYSENLSVLPTGNRSYDVLPSSPC